MSTPIIYYKFALLGGTQINIDMSNELLGYSILRSLYTNFQKMSNELLEACQMDNALAAGDWPLDVGEPIYGQEGYRYIFICMVINFLTDMHSLKVLNCGNAFVVQSFWVRYFKTALSRCILSTIISSVGTGQSQPVKRELHSRHVLSFSQD